MSSSSNFNKTTNDSSNDNVSSTTGLPNTSGSPQLGVQEQHVSIASQMAPTWVIGSLPVDSLVVPFRSSVWEWNFTDLADVGITCEPHDNSMVKTALSRFGFCYWRSLYMELRVSNEWAFFDVSILGGWSWCRSEALTKGSIARLATAEPYHLKSGDTIRLECPFGGLISPLISGRPVVGERAALFLHVRASNNHPFIPAGDAPTQPAPGVMTCISARLHGEMVVAAPTPQLFLA